MIMAKIIRRTFCNDEWKKVSVDEFFMTTWERENESERKKEPQILRQEHAMFKNTNAKIQD